NVDFDRDAARIFLFVFARGRRCNGVVYDRTDRQRYKETRTSAKRGELTHMHPLIFLMIVFFVLLIVRVPIAFAIGLSAIATILYIDLPFTTIINQMFSGLDSFPLLAVPLFLLVGKLMNDGGITDRLVHFASSLVGHIRGGLGHINVAVSMLFAGLSGSAAAVAAAIRY